MCSFLPPPQLNNKLTKWRGRVGKWLGVNTSMWNCSPALLWEVSTIWWCSVCSQVHTLPDSGASSGRLCSAHWETQRKLYHQQSHHIWRKVSGREHTSYWCMHLSELNMIGCCYWCMHLSEFVPKLLCPCHIPRPYAGNGNEASYTPADCCYSNTVKTWVLLLSTCAAMEGCCLPGSGSSIPTLWMVR